MIYIFSSIIIIFINVVPIFMPPTWTVVSYIYIRYHVNLVIITLVGACSSTFGRILLARFAKGISGRIFSVPATKNLHFIGSKIEGNPVKMFIIAFIWAISPVGSNPLFISVGLSSVLLRPIVAGFFIGRTISYAFLAYTSKVIINNMSSIATQGITDWKKIVIELIGLIIIFFYLAVDWRRLLSERKIRFNFNIFKGMGKEK